MMKTRSRSFTIYIYILFLMLGSLATVNVNGQSTDENLVQLSGIISSGNTGNPLPFSTARVKGTYRGTIAGPDGFYSFVVKEHDTIEYSSVGYKKITFVIPVDNEDQKLIHNVKLIQDTITYEEIVVYPWPSKEEFREAFLSLKVDDDLYDIAQRNMSQEKMQELYESLAKDGREQQLYTLQQIAHSYYYAGGQTNYMFLGNSGVPIPSSLLNPFAWTQFIQSIKNGDFKKKK